MNSLHEFPESLLRQSQPVWMHCQQTASPTLNISGQPPDRLKEKNEEGEEEKEEKEEEIKEVGYDTKIIVLILKDTEKNTNTYTYTYTHEASS